MTEAQRTEDPVFEAWWRDHGNPGYNVVAMNLAFKELCKRAWDAAMKQAEEDAYTRSMERFAHGT